MTKPQPWSPADATKAINSIAQDEELKISYTEHAKTQMASRDLIVGDALFVLRRGFVLEEPQPASQSGLFKYRIESRTPNSGNRTVRVVAIPEGKTKWIKIITVMWVDE